MSDNITPLPRPKLQQRAQSIADQILFAGDIRANLDSTFLVSGWLSEGGLSVVVAAPNVGKTFFALWLAYCVSKGIHWGKRRVRRKRVLYIAGEGGGAFLNRIAALDSPDFWVLNGPMTLVGGPEAVTPLVEALCHLADGNGDPWGLIVIDTMARVMGGADENTAPAIANLMRNIDMIRHRTGAHVMLIHHSGKDPGKGARGHSSLRAAVDTEIEITRDGDEGLITAEVTKQRDGATGYTFSYTLEQVRLGVDQDGEDVTTRVVRQVA